jgi:hypothetical protein
MPGFRLVPSGYDPRVTATYRTIFMPDIREER